MIDFKYFFYVMHKEPILFLFCLLKEQYDTYLNFLCDAEGKNFTDNRRSKNSSDVRNEQTFIYFILPQQIMKLLLPYDPFFEFSISNKLSIVVYKNIVDVGKVLSS